MRSNEAMEELRFSGKNTTVYFDADFSLLEEKLKSDSVIYITDENVFNSHREKFFAKKVVVIKPGEKFKNQETANYIIDQLIPLDADRGSFIVGVGGGVVTDITGFVASIYMRGVKFGFVPTSILAMVDASVGGKNGIDIGVYKNLVGVINHPAFILYDYSFLKTLPDGEWISGFAEIIKHSCIRDREMFHELQKFSIKKFQSSATDTAGIIERNVHIKYNVVANDEFEKGDRKLLNFGHTIGHAIENTTRLAHGKAISIGMHVACKISEVINHFDTNQTKLVTDLLQQYQLPVAFDFDKEETWKILLHDKKKTGSDMNFIVLDSIGQASVKKIPLAQLHNIFKSIE